MISLAEDSLFASKPSDLVISYNPFSKMGGEKRFSGKFVVVVQKTLISEKDCIMEQVISLEGLQGI